MQPWREEGSHAAAAARELGNAGEQFQIQASQPDQQIEEKRPDGYDCSGTRGTRVNRRILPSLLHQHAQRQNFQLCIIHYLILSQTLEQIKKLL